MFHAETKDQVLERLLREDKPKCPYCETEMNLWEVPQLTACDGLGWGTPYLWICFNDECTLYANGWKNMRENYGRNSSYRCMCYPGTHKPECIPVFSPEGAKGQIIDAQVAKQEQVLVQKTKKGLAVLDTCKVEKNYTTTIKMLTSAEQPQRVRLKSAEIIGEIGTIECIEPIRNAKFGNDLIQKAADDSIKKIHERFFTRECPHCAEIIKKRAKICKHCNQDVAGK